VFRPIKIGVRIEESMPAGTVMSDGEPERWVPYKLWSADLFECPGCGAQIVAAFGERPIAEHYQPEYAQMAMTSLGRVEDKRPI
jgi:hypothetical protein